jgi:hypothetical protein
MISSKDYNPQVGGGVNKVLQPGTHYCRIIDMKLVAPSYKPEAYDIVFTLESEPIGGDFIGIAIDKNNPALGNYVGTVGTVKSGQYPFSDFIYKDEMIRRDDQMFRWIMTFAKQLGVLEAIMNDGLEASTIEDYFADLKKYFIRPDFYIHFTIAGQEYFKEGYNKPNYYLFFPKMSKGFYPYSAIYENDEAQNLLIFDPTIHIVAKKKADTSPVIDSFSGQADQIKNNNLDDIDRGINALTLDLPY